MRRAVKRCLVRPSPCQGPGRKPPCLIRRCQVAASNQSRGQGYGSSSGGWNDQSRGQNAGYGRGGQDQGSGSGSPGTLVYEEVWLSGLGNQDNHYRNLRNRQMRELDEDYRAYCGDREKEFGENFERFRSEREEGRSGEDSDKEGSSSDDKSSGSSTAQRAGSGSSSSQSKSSGSSSSGSSSSGSSSSGGRSQSSVRTSKQS